MKVALKIKSASRNSTPPITFFSSRSSLGSCDTCGIVRFNLRELCMAQTGRPEEDDLNMEKANNNKNNDEDQKNKKDDDEDVTVKAGDAMEHSFGEGYATRSDEEGFGGVYLRYDSHKLRKPGEIDEDHPEYDKSQGSEVKEKEKARFQKNASS